MGRGLFACAVLALAATVALAGCQPLYGRPPEKLTKLRKKKRPEKTKEDKPPVKYVEDCTTNFRDDPKRVFRDQRTSNNLMASGDEALAQAVHATDTNAQIDLIRTSIDKYRSALIKDPYNAQATLKLALAYDKVYRKGCALKLLARIQAIEGNDKFRADAKRAADQVNDTPEWFRGYHDAAKQAVGR